LIRCPGKLPPGVGNMGRKLSFNDMELVSYLPPQELTENCTEIGEPITRIAQIFGHEIGLPHLLQLQTRLQSCNANIGQAKSQLKPETTITRFTPLVPPPESTSSSMYRFPCYSHDIFIQLLTQNCFRHVASGSPDRKEADDDSEYEVEEIDMELLVSAMDAIPCDAITTSHQQTSALPTATHKHLVTKQPSDQSTSPKHPNLSTVASKQLTILGRPPLSPVGAIVSIRPATDKAIDRLNLTDDWIVSLRHLITSHHNTR